MTLIFSLVGGLAIALIIQLLFASLGLALGLTILDLSPKEKNTEKTETSKPSQTEFSLPVTHLLGFGIAIGVSGIIFTTAFISTDFSAIIQSRRGIIYGLICWATYWTLLIWLSTTTIAGIVDFLFGGAIAGIKQLLSTLKGSPDPQESDEDSVLEGLASELDKIVDLQQALPALIASQREELVREISDRTQLSPAQTETILTDIASPEPETEPEPKVSPTVYSTNASPTELLSQISSTLDLPSWQQLSQSVIDQIDFSEIEALAYQLPSLLQEKRATSSQSVRANLVHNEAIAKVTSDSSPRTVEAVDNQTGVAKEVQKKLIAYCRYTNVDLLTPENMTAKIEAQAKEHSVELEHLQVDIVAIESVLSRRQNLAEDNRQALIEVLESVWHDEKASVETTIASYPQKIQQALESSVASIEWQEILAPSLNEAGSLVDQMKTQIARYLQKQDKLAFHPVQMSKDLAHIVAHGLRSLPHPSDLPNLGELETLWDKSSWQRALERRKDLTVDEIQEILAWGEAAWQPVVKQTSTWLKSLNAQAEKLLSAVDSLAVDSVS